MDQGIERAVRERRPDPTLPGVVALCPTRRACEQELRSTFEEWLVLGLKLGHALPLIGGIDLNHGPAREPVDTL
ncbi:MAG: type II toxin-antitoxin system HicB family antitoxin [Acidobacteria bacterium]|nr:type II toxin-antitoxin system HicB family antitoxin [Acidobacteriota bacterium]MBI3470083.1 type II toxin-antitoxin system HicB family antitoxin [Candidatus Solibacter usitatus]